MAGSMLDKVLGWRHGRIGEKIGVLTLPVLFLFLFVISPLCLIFVYSFFSIDMTTGVLVTEFTLDNYVRFFQQKLFADSLIRTIVITLTVTAISLSLSYPVAYFVAIKAPRKWQPILLLLIVLPSWSSFLVRSFSWMAVLRSNGVLDGLLIDLGVIDVPLSLLYTRGAVIIGLVHAYMPFMVLGIYACLRTIDMSLVNSARDLGATPYRAFIRVILPLSYPGIATGILLGGVPVLGAFITPKILGGPGDLLVGNLIDMQFTEVFNWPLGAAMSAVISAFVIVGIILFLRKFGDRWAGTGESNANV